MICIAEIINDYVEKKLNLPFKIDNDAITTAADGACLRHDPSAKKERAFNDGSAIMLFNLSYYIRCKNAAKAREYTKAIGDALDGHTFTDDETGTEVYCETTASENYIGVDTKNLTTYSTAIKCTYMQQAEE